MPEAGAAANNAPSIQEFEELKRAFATAEDFGVFWNHFIDDFASRPGFMQLGSPAHVEEMEILICRVASQLAGELVEPVNTRIIKIPEAKFAHGSCVVQDQLGCVLYFEDLEMGLFVLMAESGKTSYARFTLRGKHQQT